MGPTWGPPGSCRPQMGPMLAQWTLLSGTLSMEAVSMTVYRPVLWHRNACHVTSSFGLKPSHRVGDAKLWCVFMVAWISCWINIRAAGGLRRHGAHMMSLSWQGKNKASQSLTFWKAQPVDYPHRTSVVGKISHRDSSKCWSTIIWRWIQRQHFWKNTRGSNARTPRWAWYDSEAHDTTLLAAWPIEREGTSPHKYEIYKQISTRGQHGSRHVCHDINQTVGATALQ